MKNYEHFKATELMCKCSDVNCWGKLQDMNPTFMSKLITARKLADIPFIISSGARCQKHNKSIGGAKLSAHLATIDKQACAVDIKCSGRSAYKILKACLQAQLLGVGVSQKKGEPNFVHVDNKQDSKNRPFLWSY